uniref:Golgin subfamily A member 7 n=1 Tax=Maylandia zebra TaxID=106582 RepID=A0A3P9DPK7_9CICH
MAETHSLQDLQQPAVSSKVFIQRDYSSGTICKFQTKFPSELESRVCTELTSMPWLFPHCFKFMFLKLLLWFQIDKQQFEETIQTLNNLYAEAEKLGGKSYLEGCLACLTAYTIFLCMETHYEKVKQKKGSHQSLMLWVTVPQIIVELLLNHSIFGSKLYVSRHDNVYTCI